jgi:hypothetical protein
MHHNKIHCYSIHNVRHRCSFWSVNYSKFENICMCPGPSFSLWFIDECFLGILPYQKW